MHVMQFISFLALYVWNSPAQANEDAYISAYIEAPISNCEVRNLSSYWSKSTKETKIAIGQAITEKKISSRHPKPTKAHETKVWQIAFGFGLHLRRCRSHGFGMGCRYRSQDGFANIAAKESFLLPKNFGGQHTAKQKSAPKPKQTGEEAFFASKYDWCHAKMLSKAYGLNSVYEAKVWIGDLLNTGDLGLLQAKMGFAQGEAEKNPQNQCSFTETRFSYQDAEKLASMWKVSTAEAKVALQNKYLFGLEFHLEEQLRR